ncbi:hypothetical protein [uncultured Flavobacterium sp.]|uniref:hypothetical protein n=1 Tax=uncultured Flavobacterium sp. TaxID=165435 RepID=UPI003081EC06
MSDFLDYSAIKRKIESEVCAGHNVSPEFIKTAKGFQINSCCEEFKDKLVEKAKKNIAEQTKITVEKMLKKAFKR